MSGKFEIFSRSSGFYFRLRAATGQPLLASESYATMAGARSAVASVKADASDDARYERRKTPVGHAFVFKTRNGEPIGTSEVFTIASSRDRVIESVKSVAPGASVVELP